MTGSGQTTELWGRKRSSDRFLTKSCFRQLTCCDLLEWSLAWFRSDRSTSDLWHCILTFRRPSDVMTLVDPMLPYSGQISDFIGLLMSWYRIQCHVAHFSHRSVHRAAWPYQKSIRGHWPLLLLGDFSGEDDVAPFRDALSQIFCQNIVTIRHFTLF